MQAIWGINEVNLGCNLPCLHLSTPFFLFLFTSINPCFPTFQDFLQVIGVVAESVANHLNAVLQYILQFLKANEIQGKDVFFWWASD